MLLWIDFTVLLALTEPVHIRGNEFATARLKVAWAMANVLSSAPNFLFPFSLNISSV